MKDLAGEAPAHAEGLCYMLTLREADDSDVVNTTTGNDDVTMGAPPSLRSESTERHLKLPTWAEPSSSVSSCTNKHPRERSPERARPSKGHDITNLTIIHHDHITHCQDIDPPHHNANHRQDVDPHHHTHDIDPPHHDTDHHHVTNQPHDNQHWNCELKNSRGNSHKQKITLMNSKAQKPSHNQPEDPQHHQSHD